MNQHEHVIWPVISLFWTSAAFSNFCLLVCGEQIRLMLIHVIYCGTKTQLFRFRHSAPNQSHQFNVVMGLIWPSVTWVEFVVCYKLPCSEWVTFFSLVFLSHKNPFIFKFQFNMVEVLHENQVKSWIGASRLDIVFFLL